MRSSGLSFLTSHETICFHLNISNKISLLTCNDFLCNLWWKKMLQVSRSNARIMCKLNASNDGMTASVWGFISIVSWRKKKNAVLFFRKIDDFQSLKNQCLIEKMLDRCLNGFIVLNLCDLLVVWSSDFKRFWKILAYNWLSLHAVVDRWVVLVDYLSLTTILQSQFE